ncbi:MAG: hypothetical protein HFE04_00830 [Bacilli bacterium]|nr:hypothetical protein [Bacilli bacterium]
MKQQILIALVYFTIVYLITFLLYALILNRKRKSYKEGKKQMEINYLVKKFKLDMKKTNYKTLKWSTTFINPFIISTTFVAVISIESFVLSLLLGFIIMMLLIYSTYEILGRALKKKEGKKDV